jgi:hypothetical protein
MKRKQAKPFAPFPLQKLQCYYDLVRRCYLIPSLYVCLLQNDSNFSCSMQNPTLPSCWLYSGCYVNSNRFSFTLVTGTNVSACFQHRLFHFTKLYSQFNLFSSTMLTFGKSMFPFFLIVHHKKSFRFMQHKVVCKLLPEVVCGSSILLSLNLRWFSRFA